VLPPKINFFLFTFVLFMNTPNSWLTIRNSCDSSATTCQIRDLAAQIVSSSLCLPFLTKGWNSFGSNWNC
jgi:hypothetical protein